MSKPAIYCEPFTIKDGYDFEIHHVSYLQHDSYSCFMHFHQVHEFIFFEHIDGTYFYHQGESKLSDYDAVFTPAMETHDFELKPRSKSWYIVQFMPQQLNTEALREFNELLKTGLHLSFSVAVQKKLHNLLAWLLSEYNENPTSKTCKQLFNSLITLVCEYGKNGTETVKKPRSSSASFKKLIPIIDVLKTNAGINFSLEQAADMCHLSPSYFSRVFKKHFRIPYSDYLIQHKLYNAARLLGQSDISVTDIAYDLGFSSPSYFIKQFKFHFKVTPHQYRQQLR
ncbi:MULTISPECIES: AraC family transcriptional regulator [unclassified Pseudoalteromonas]|uniref:helix-turn-helix transcriptional regulator n=1 Tax=unclassified Pseudoalteromonas TaxID=194690 RepID=UPI001594AEAB|nr:MULTISPECIES: AraC family transcriptional regulator [unclassified Pseudoalteromonas]MDN3377842.1 AraC family transcriptional regulator [Pseudoalteromonas sp. APC 3893]MDN3386038.1 AraC family transcriptional regulator [Pseudoalteromonas sp. APC 4017]